LKKEAKTFGYGARAKINLYLHVTGRRSDGYHLLDSLAVFADVRDYIEAKPADTLSLTIDGPFGQALTAEPDNLVLRAARALAEAAGIEPAAALRLTKTLPVASGIGGGSADAAATLHVLSDLWHVPVPPSLPASLGADVPVCMASRACRMQGIGEILAPAPELPACGLVLVNPGVAVSTPSVFRARTGGFTPPADLPPAWTDAAGMAEALARLTNDLQAPAEALCPAISDVLTALRSHPACLLARMSGSGATCFGLTRTPAQASQVAAALARPGWWCWGGSLR
jgi:4-diphosphocytidyl-2-C-methyl-D-erythritol kinase